MTVAQETPHNISQSTLTISQNGSYTVTGTTTTNRIVVNENVTATVTLNSVNITGVQENSVTGAPAQSPIDLADGATLTLILAESSTNTLTGGAGTSYCGAPGIHVPDDAALIIQGSGSLSVSGGSYTDGYGAPGIGGTTDTSGATSGNYTGEDCGTVIILSSENLNVKGGTGSAGNAATDIGGGSGFGLGDGGLRPAAGGTAKPDQRAGYPGVRHPGRHPAPDLFHPGGHRGKPAPAGPAGGEGGLPIRRL